MINQVKKKKQKKTHLWLSPIPPEPPNPAPPAGDCSSDAEGDEGDAPPSTHTAVVEATEAALLPRLIPPGPPKRWDPPARGKTGSTMTVSVSSSSSSLSASASAAAVAAARMAAVGLMLGLVLGLLPPPSSIRMRSGRLSRAYVASASRRSVFVSGGLYVCVRGLEGVWMWLEGGRMGIGGGALTHTATHYTYKTIRTLGPRDGGAVPVLVLVRKRHACRVRKAREALQAPVGLC